MKVKVLWSILVDGNGYCQKKDGSDWRRDWLNEEVVETRKFRDGKTYHLLRGRPCCPVRIERCEILTA